MKKILLGSLVVASLAAANETIQLESGWQLLGTSTSIKDMSIFDNGAIKTVWSYDKTTESWKAFSSDSDTKKLIADSSIVNPLHAIGSNKGFWVNANYKSVLTIPTDSFDANATSSFYVDKLKDVNVSLVADKSFKFVERKSIDSSKLNYRTVTFNADGIATYTIDPDACYADENATTVTVTIRVEDKNLNFYQDGHILESYKLLATNSVGTVFGTLDITDYKYSEYTPAPVFYILNDDAVESPVDMSKKTYPLNAYSTNYAKNGYVTFDSNLTATYHNDTNSFDIGTYSFGDAGQILLTNSNHSDDGKYHSTVNEEYQPIYSIGRYNVVKDTIAWKGWSSDVYVDENTTLNLADQNITNWKQLFVATNNVFEGSTYDSNGSISYNGSESDETYTISEDGKTLITTNKYGCYEPEYDTITDDYKIVNIWNGIRTLLTSNSPVFNDFSALPHLDGRVLNITRKSKEETLHNLIMQSYRKF